MPFILKIILTLAVLWSTVYSVSYAIFQFKRKKHKSAISTLVLAVLMIALLILSDSLPISP